MLSSVELVKSPSMSRNLFLTICCYGVLGIYTELQMMTFSTLAVPLGEIFNYTLYHHYRVTASAAGVSLIFSGMTLAMVSGAFVSTCLLLPRLDTRGRKFVAVYARFVIGATVAILQMLAGWTTSAELYMFGQVLIGVSIPCSNMAIVLYLTECAPDMNRGLVTTSLQFSLLIGSLLMFFISDPGILGNSQAWTIIPAITLVLSVLLFLATVALPESPKWLMSKGRKEEARRAVAFYHGADADIDGVLMECIEEAQLTKEAKLSPREVWSDSTLRTAMKLIVAIQVFFVLSLVPVEGLYSVVINTKLGLTVSQTLQLKLMIHLFLSPLRLFGTVLIDRYGRRFVLFLAGFIAIVKVHLMMTAQTLNWLGASTVVTSWIVVANEILMELYACTGVAALATLLVAELIPPSARVSSAQLIFVASFISAMPMTLGFPVINSTFAPGFYIPVIILQPLFLYYLYKNLPETAAKKVTDIVHDLDDDVRSRANTRRQSVLSQRSRLLTQGSVFSYNSIN